MDPFSSINTCIFTCNLLKLVVRNINYFKNGPELQLVTSSGGRGGASTSSQSLALGCRQCLELPLTGSPANDEMFLASRRDFQIFPNGSAHRSACHVLSSPLFCLEHLYKAPYIYPSMPNVPPSGPFCFPSPCRTFAVEIIKRPFHVVSKGGDPVNLLPGGGPSGEEGSHV